MEEKTGFLHLPPEIRMLIYTQCLVSHPLDFPSFSRFVNPQIEIWSPPTNYSKHVDVKESFIFDPVTQLQTQTIVKTTTTVSESKIGILEMYPNWRCFVFPYKAGSLFLCSKTIHHEATAVYYSRNTFKFVIKGEYGWQALHNWLDIIGPRNRSFLANLVIAYDSIQLVKLDHDGNVIRRQYSSLKNYPRCSYLTRSHGPECVEVISSTIGKIFEKLSSRANTLTILLKLPFKMWPKEYPDSDSEDAEEEYPFQYNCELGNFPSVPNTIEKYRAMYGNSSIAVRWNGIEHEDEWIRRHEVFESWGWEVLKTGKPDPYPPFAVECTLRKLDTI